MVVTEQQRGGTSREGFALPCTFRSGLRGKNLGEPELLDGLKPGDRLPRREVHARFGGRQQGGIGPSSKSPVVLFFTDPATGQRHGYYDGWDNDGYFNYVGEGQTGDQ